MKKLAILAGRGLLPQKIAQSAQNEGWDVLVIGFEGFADFQTFSKWPSFSVRLGQVEKIIQILQEQHCHDVVMIGAVARPNLKDLSIDRMGWSVLRKWGLKFFSGDNQLLSLIVDFFKKQGFKIHGAHEFLGPDKISHGVLTKYVPSSLDKRDVIFGQKMMCVLGPYDVGQACVIQNGVTLAIEAMEGTDAMLARAKATRQPGEGGVLVKCGKPGQEKNVDMPVIGQQTIRNAYKASLNGIAFDPENTLIVDLPSCQKIADKLKIFLWGTTLTSHCSS